MQLMSGIKLWVYWISNYIWDVFTIALASGLCVFIASAFGTASMKDENVLPAAALCLIFAWSVTPFTYIFSRFFAGPATAQGLFLLFELTASVLMMIATFILVTSEYIYFFWQILKMRNFHSNSNYIWLTHCTLIISKDLIWKQRPYFMLQICHRLTELLLKSKIIVRIPKIHA